MAAGRANVGSVSVSVVPDATGFSAKLGAQIDPVVQALGQKIGQDISSSITRSIRDAITQGLVQGGAGSGAQGKRQGDEYGGSFATAFRARITEATRALPEIKLTANSSDAEIKLQGIREQLDTLSKKTVGIDIDEGAALAELELLRAKIDEINRNATSIVVKADTARATEALDRLIAEIEAVGADKATVKVDVDTSEADAKLAETDAAAGATSGGFSGLIAAGIALGPALIPVIAAVAAALLGLISILGAGVIGFGVLALGFSGVIKGVTDLDAANNKAASSGRSAASSALSQAGAAQQIQQAEASLANTRASAASSAVRSAEEVKNAKAAEKAAELDWATSVGQAEHDVNVARTASAAATQTAAQNNAAAAATLVTSERSLAQAQKDSTDAQNALTQARVTAAQQQQDLANQVVDGLQAQQGATLDVADARNALTAAQATDPSESQEATQRAELAYQQALQHLSELQTANQRLADQKKASDQAGIEGSSGVVAAQNQVAQANQAVIDAQTQVAQSTQNVANVQKAGAAAIVAAQLAVGDAVAKVHKEWAAGDDAVKKAEQGVSDALRAQADQQRQSAFSIQQALDGVAAAHRAAASAALGGGAAISSQADAFSKLSPAVQDFAQFIVKDVQPAFKGIQDAAAAGLLPGVEAGLKLLLPAFKDIKPFISDVAKALGDLFQQGAKALKDPFWAKFFDFVKANAIPAIQGIAHFIGDVITGFAGLVQAFAPVTGSVGNGVLDLADNFKKFGEQAGNPDSPFQKFIRYVQTYGPVVAQVFDGIYQTVKHLVEGLTPVGDEVLRVVAAMASFLSTVSPAQLRAVSLAAGGVALALKAISVAGSLAELNPVVLALALVAGGAYLLYTHSATVRDFINDKLLPIFHELADYFTSTVLPVLKHIGEDALQGIQDAIARVAQAITDHKPELQELYGTFKQAVDFIVEHVLPLLGPVLKDAFIGAGAVIANFVDVISSIVDAFDAVSSAAPGIWDDIHHFFSLGVHDVLQVVHDFVATINAVLGTIGVKLPNVDMSNFKVYDAPGSPSSHGGPNRAFSWGGVLPGYAPGVDSIHALLSPGEAVLVPEAAALLGPDWIYRINHYASGGRAPLQRFSGGGIVNDITGAAGGAFGAITGIGGDIANATLAPLIHQAESAAKSAAHGLLPAGMFRDLADGTIDLLGSSLKFSGGGLATPWSGAAGTAIASDGTPAGGGNIYNQTLHNHVRPMSGRDMAIGLQQMHAMSGQSLFAGTGFGG